jgi:methyltransferase (TIGR00027 family)
MRALDRQSPPESRIVDDPFAAWFLGPLARGRLAAGSALSTGLVGYVQCRHRMMDDALASALEAVEQVVVLGAGYDMRAYRFADSLGGRPVFEVDYPSTQARKVGLLGGRALPAADVRRVGIDFQSQTLDQVLLPAGFQPGKATFFTWEGVSMYLTRAAVKGTLAALAALSGPGSRLTMDFWMFPDLPDVVGTAHRVSAGLLHLFSEPVTFALHPEDAPGFLGGLGWRATDVADRAELTRRYVRDYRPVYPWNFVVVAELLRADLRATRPPQPGPPGRGRAGAER